LTLQAIVQALSEREETVKEMLVSREKVTTSALAHKMD
jgi:hypothetical protein